MISVMTKLHTMVRKQVQKRRTIKRRYTARARQRRHDQQGGFLAALIPLLALAGFGVKKAIDAARK